MAYTRGESHSPVQGEEFFHSDNAVSHYDIPKLRLAQIAPMDQGRDEYIEPVSEDDVDWWRRHPECLATRRDMAIDDTQNDIGDLYDSCQESDSDSDSDEDKCDIGECAHSLRWTRPT